MKDTQDGIKSVEEILLQEKPGVSLRFLKILLTVFVITGVFGFILMSKFPSLDNLFCWGLLSIVAACCLLISFAAALRQNLY